MKTDGTRSTRRNARRRFRNSGLLPGASTRADIFWAANELDLTSKGATVRVRDGKRMVTDGPFAETKEQLGGYYLIEAKDREEAIAIAARIPSVSWGSIEVRPVIPHPMP